MKKLVATFLSLSVLCSTAFARGGPVTVATVNVDTRAFLKVLKVGIPKGEVVFVELSYDTYSPMYLNTFLSSHDTALGLYDSGGNLIAENDDATFPGNQTSDIRPGTLQPGNYFLAVGIDDVTFGQDFEATSNSVNAAEIDLTIGTFPMYEGLPYPLQKNYNGIVHFGEGMAPDSTSGFRSISDRALDFRMGTPEDLISAYDVTSQSNELDMIFLGNRNTASGGFAFDKKIDGDCIGIQPDWLDDPDQTMPNETSFSFTGEFLAPFSHVGVLYQIDGGGSFDVVIKFKINCPCGSELELRKTITGADWLSGEPGFGCYPSTTDSDCATPDFQNQLTVSEAIIDLTDVFIDAGPYNFYFLDSIRFELNKDTEAVAVLGASFGFVGIVDFAPKGDFNFDGFIDILDVAPFVDSVVVGSYDYIADINDDCVVDLLDVEPFIDLLIGN